MACEDPTECHALWPDARVDPLCSRCGVDLRAAVADVIVGPVVEPCQHEHRRRVVLSDLETGVPLGVAKLCIAESCGTILGLIEYGVGGRSL